MVILTLQKPLWSVSGDEGQWGHGLHERAFSGNSTTPPKPNKALQAIRGWLTLARTLESNMWTEWTLHAVSSSCYQSNHVFTEQLPNPIALPSYYQVNHPTSPCKLFLELLGEVSLNTPSTLELSRHAGFSMCHFPVFVYGLFVISLLEWVSVYILRDKWRDQVWGECLSLVFDLLYPSLSFFPFTSLEHCSCSAE